MLQVKDVLDDVIVSMCIETGRTIRVKVNGWSMWPLVRNGDVLGIRPDLREIRKGDIILFRSSGRLIAHRVIKASLGIFTVKGDALTVFDQPVYCRHVIGRVVFIEIEGNKTDIDTSLWRVINRILASYSCACGIIFGIINGWGLTAENHSTSRIIGAINLLLPMFIYILTKRL